MSGTPLPPIETPPAGPGMPHAADAELVRILVVDDQASNLEAMGLARIWTRALYRVEPDEAAPAVAGRPS